MTRWCVFCRCGLTAAARSAQKQLRGESEGGFGRLSEGRGLRRAAADSSGGPSKHHHSSSCGHRWSWHGWTDGGHAAGGCRTPGLSRETADSLDGFQ